MIKYVFWDFDGTLFNTYPAIALTYLEVLQKDYQTTFDYQQILKWTRKGLDFCASQLGEALGIDKAELKERFERRYLQGPTLEELPFPGAKEVCEYVNSIGGANFIVTHRGSYTLNKLLKKHKMDMLFKELVSADNNFPRKPDPASFEYLLSKYRLGRNQVIAVGDRELDIEAALLAGIKSCFFSMEGKIYPKADYQVKDLLELKKIISS